MHFACQAFPHLMRNMEKLNNLSRLKGLMTQDQFNAIKEFLKKSVIQSLTGKSAKDKDTWQNRFPRLNIFFHMQVCNANQTHAIVRLS